jgi:hypothetical protein
MKEINKIRIKTKRKRGGTKNEGRNNIERRKERRLPKVED